jgi:DNA-binding MurR/RpiR family transcriptional regulator
MVAISLPRYPRETLELMDYAREERVTVAAITDSVLSPVAKRADVTLPVHAEPVTFVDAYCVVQALLTAIVVQYSQLSRDRTQTMLRRFERVASRNAIFHSDD